MAKVMKTELIDRVAERAGVTKQTTREVIDALLEEVTDLLTDGIEVQLIDFGKFVPFERAARAVHNVTTGQMMEVPPRVIAKFRPSEALNRRLNGR